MPFGPRVYPRVMPSLARLLALPLVQLPSARVFSPHSSSTPCVFCCGLSHSGTDRKRERDALRREARRHIRFEAETAKFMEIMEKLAAAARLDRTDEDVAAIYEDGDIDGDMCTQKHVQKTNG
jgi:hypothetical protein